MSGKIQGLFSGQGRAGNSNLIFWIAVFFGKQILLFDFQYLILIFDGSSHQRKYFIYTEA